MEEKQVSLLQALLT